MKHWVRISRDITERFKREAFRKPRGFRQALEFCRDHLEENPGATAADIERAGTREGLDPATVFLLSLIATLVVELWRKWSKQ